MRCLLIARHPECMPRMKRYALLPTGASVDAAAHVCRQSVRFSPRSPRPSSSGKPLGRKTTGIAPEPGSGRRPPCAGLGDDTRQLLVFGTVLFLGCALGQSGPPLPTPVWVRSHNISAVDVYLLCGDHDAQWLGTVEAKQSEAFEIPSGYRGCMRGLNFFVVVQRSSRGYWVGPFRPQPSNQVDLVIEKYAGLSAARLIP
jgi:hypothetical protein